MKKSERIAYKEALKTYNHQCALCGYHVVELHHIIYRRYGLTVKENLIPLCKTHHTLAHSDQKKWTDILLDLNRKHYGMINKDDLRKKGRYYDYAIPN